MLVSRLEQKTNKERRTVMGVRVTMVEQINYMRVETVCTLIIMTKD